MSAGPDTPRTRVEQTVLSLREDIISGELEAESRLGVDMLKERYGVGASTIREALSLLCADNLATAEGQRGFRVAPLSPDDLADLSEARKVLETHALRQSILNGDDEWEAAIVAAFHRLSLAQDRLDAHEPGAAEEWEARNRDFHSALSARSTSARIRDMLANLARHFERYRRAAVESTFGADRDIGAEHKALMDAALARDVDAATEALSVHLDNTVDVIAKAYAAAHAERAS